MDIKMITLILDGFEYNVRWTIIPGKNLILAP